MDDGSGSAFVTCDEIRQRFGLDPRRTTFADLRGARWGFAPEDGARFVNYENGVRTRTVAYTRIDTSRAPLALVIEEGRVSADAYIFDVGNLVKFAPVSVRVEAT